MRLRFVRAQRKSARQYLELTVRSRIVKGMANIYMERHVQDLVKKEDSVINDLLREE